MAVVPRSEVLSRSGGHSDRIAAVFFLEPVVPGTRFLSKPSARSDGIGQRRKSGERNP